MKYLLTTKSNNYTTLASTFKTQVKPIASKPIVSQPGK